MNTENTLTANAQEMEQPGSDNPKTLETRLGGLSAQATPVLESNDPLVLVEQAIRNLGYGGDIKPALITYLAITSRLLSMRPGSMPVHLLLVGQASAGKSYTLGVVFKLLPLNAIHKIDSGSPRVLIYDEESIRHKALIFSEADSLPAGEDNPAASAIRSLLQDHFLHYHVVEKDPETGRQTVREIQKEAPAVLLPRRLDDWGINSTVVSSPLSCPTVWPRSKRH